MRPATATPEPDLPGCGRRARAFGLSLGLWLVACSAALGGEPAAGLPGQLKGEDFKAAPQPGPAPAEVGAAGVDLLAVVQATLDNQPSILLGRLEVEFQEGRLVETRGEFDWALQQNLGAERYNEILNKLQRRNSGHDQLRQDIYTYSVGLTKTTRTGLQFVPRAEFSRVDDQHNTADSQHDTDSAVFFGLRAPLLRGRGRAAAGADERATELTRAAAQLDYLHSVGTAVRASVVAYWRFRAAQEYLRLREETEKRAAHILEETALLVDANVYPNTEKLKIEANLRAKTSTRIQAEQDLVEARHQLGLAMGLGGPGIEALMLAAEAFPAARPGPTGADGQSLLALARSQRTDLQAAAKVREAAQVRLTAARINLKPRLDLGADVGWRGLEQGGGLDRYFGSLDNSAGGLDWKLALNFEMPLGNHAAEGVAIQRLAEYNRTVILQQDLERRIGSAVQVAWSALAHGLDETAKARESVKYYQEALGNEGERFRLGTATLLDLLDLEDRLADASLLLIDSQLRYASALVELRYQTGALIGSADGRQRIGHEELLSIP